MKEIEIFKNQLVEMLKGGFAPNVILLREFDYEKCGIVLAGLPFSAWSLLEHMRNRQKVLLNFMSSPEEFPDVWPEAYWPKIPVPDSKKEWNNSIDIFEEELTKMISLVESKETELLKPQKNGKTISWAAMATLHHNAYTIGQIKAIGRQLGVW